MGGIAPRRMQVLGASARLFARGAETEVGQMEMQWDRPLRLTGGPARGRLSCRAMSCRSVCLVLASLRTSILRVR